MTPQSESRTFKPKRPSKNLNQESNNRFALLAGDDDGEVCVYSGATISIVSTNFKLENESATPNGIRVYSCTDGAIISSSKYGMYINLPQKGRDVNKVNVNQPLFLIL